MEWLLGTSAGLLAYTYLGYPALAGALARLWPRPVWLAPIEPTISLVIVARNEERALEAKLENALVTFQLDAHGKVERAKMIAASPLADFSYDYQDLDLRPVGDAE